MDVFVKLEHVSVNQSQDGILSAHILILKYGIVEACGMWYEREMISNARHLRCNAREKYFWVFPLINCHDTEMIIVSARNGEAVADEQVFFNSVGLINNNTVVLS
jgi:hypothetical protein